MGPCQLGVTYRIDESTVPTIWNAEESPSWDRYQLLCCTVAAILTCRP